VKVRPQDRRETFILHEYLLRESSIFFNNALKGEWMEAQDRVVTVPEMSAEAFEVYAKFLLTGCLFIKSDDMKLSSTRPGERRVNCDGLKLCKYAIELANFLHASDFQDGIRDAMMEICANSATNMDLADNTTMMFGDSLVTPIYTHSRSGSPPRKIIVLTCLHGFSESTYENYDFRNILPSTCKTSSSWLGHTSYPTRSSSTYRIRSTSKTLTNTTSIQFAVSRATRPSLLGSRATTAARIMQPHNRADGSDLTTAAPAPAPAPATATATANP
jgi:hypothetical protein